MTYVEDVVYCLVCGRHAECCSRGRGSLAGLTLDPTLEGFGTGLVDLQEVLDTGGINSACEWQADRTLLDRYGGMRRYSGSQDKGESGPLHCYERESD